MDVFRVYKTWSVVKVFALHFFGSIFSLPLFQWRRVSGFQCLGFIHSLLMENPSLAIPLMLNIKIRNSLHFCFSFHSILLYFSPCLLCFILTFFHLFCHVLRKLIKRRGTQHLNLSPSFKSLIHKMVFKIRHSKLIYPQVPAGIIRPILINCWHLQCACGVWKRSIFHTKL